MWKLYVLEEYTERCFIIYSSLSIAQISEAMTSEILERLSDVKSKIKIQIPTGRKFQYIWKEKGHFTKFAKQVWASEENDKHYNRQRSKHVAGQSAGGEMRMTLAQKDDEPISNQGNANPHTSELFSSIPNWP